MRRYVQGVNRQHSGSVTDRCSDGVDVIGNRTRGSKTKCIEEAFGY